MISLVIAVQIPPDMADDLNRIDDALRAVGVFGARFITDPSAGDLQDLLS